MAVAIGAGVMAGVRLILSLSKDEATQDGGPANLQWGARA